MLNHSFWSGKRVLLTGHTGFKGSWLSIFLTYLGAEDAQVFLQIPSAVGFIFQGLVLFYLLGAELLVNYKIQFGKIS